MPPTDYGQRVSGTGIVRYEKVDAPAGGDGKWHFIDRQNLDNSCGPACVRMVVQMAKDLRIGESYFRGLVALSEQSLAPSDVSPLSNAAQLGHDFDAVGTLSAHLVKALKDAKLDKARKVAPTTTDWPAVWRACSEKLPGIISVKWAGSTAAHFVVVAGPLGGSADKILVLDPAYGVQQLNVTEPTTYRPRQGGGSAGLLLATGNLQTMAVIVTN